MNYNEAFEIAQAAARSALDFHEPGKLTPVTSDAALDVLTVMFAELLMADGAPQMAELTREAAESFPNCATDTTRGTRFFIAVGADIEGRATYTMRSARCVSRSFGYAAAMRALVQATSVAGFPQ